MAMQMFDPVYQRRNERGLFATSDESAMLKQIQATHTPDGRDVNVRPLLHVIENVLRQQATPNAVGHAQALTQAYMDVLDEKNNLGGTLGMFEALAYTIHQISCEISCKCSNGGDTHATTLSLFELLSSYSWDAKIVLTLAAFAITYGEFLLVTQLHTSNHLAHSIALLKQLPDVVLHSDTLKPRFDALRNLIAAMLDVIKCIVELKELPSQYITADVSPLTIATTHVPTAAYWTIRSVVAGTSQMIALIGLSHEFITSTTEAWELSSLAHKVNSIHGHLMKQLALCHRHIDEKRHFEAYQTLLRLFDTIHIDNLKILRALFYSKDELPLMEGLTKKRVNVDVLRRKNLVLLISDLNMSQEELSILEQLYRESRGKHDIDTQFEVVWIPVVDRSTPWTEAKQFQFEEMQMMMPWYTVHQPLLIDPAVTRYIKEVWHFKTKPLLVVLDPQGKVVCPNALHMMWIWGSMAFPFTTMKEETLWREETWRLELLVNGIDPTILNWIAEDKYICLYGGEDIEWIRKFTSTARAVAQAAHIPLEMVYVGKSNPKQRVRQNIATITVEKLSNCWQDLTSIWFFWVRLESMWQSKMQLGKTVDNDAIMQEIMTMLSFDGSEQGWAVLSKGAAGISKGKGEVMLTLFSQFDLWRENAERNGFMPALNDHLRQIHTPHHCNRLILPGTAGIIPERIVCAECGKPMEKFVMYRCCTD